MRVKLIGYTQFMHDAASEATDGRWVPAEDYGHDCSDLIEFAGRQCYESWHRPNPATATNRGYLANILDHEHYSVLEHGVVSFRISEVSRSLTHELIRHRHFSFSQVSQRFVNSGKGDFIIPPLFRDDDDIVNEVLQLVWNTALACYEELVHHAEQKLIARGITGVKARKKAREAARCVLPNMTPTALVMTGNHRAWREMLLKRGSPDADEEIRQLALELYRQLRALDPAVYQDIHLSEDGTSLQRRV